ncbi:hypothetical protein BDZ94DRAFT_1151537 [Collybia nuda]|uniref:Guanine nucleotide-binding protein-like 1 n=1 Tax=Collybia nuda TaxID=64659 RepID=A0A9P5YIE1_9AGAR|nr:hypothetical protein BDZ94DRAFT_1151537 [Collybia nuda]
MPRKKPTSTRQKKADVQLKRAIKRGDVPSPELIKHAHKPKTRRGPTGNSVGLAVDPSKAAVVQAARRLQSVFINLPPRFLEETKLLSSTLLLPRPLPHHAAIYVDNVNNPGTPALSCPRRPKWRFDMTKREVERNEEGMFSKWLTEIDEVMQTQQNYKVANDSLEEKENQGAHRSEPPITMPQSPPYFERNLEVWRQLWRVIEISQIILVLVDSRCPLLHFPPSLSNYLSDRQVILVLTKVDISGSVRADSWAHYFGQHYPHLRVVQVESYVEKERGADHQGGKRHQPHLATPFRRKLVDAIAEAHNTLLQPPNKIKDNPNRLKSWKPPVKQGIDWDDMMKAGGPEFGSSTKIDAFPQPKKIPNEKPMEILEYQESEYLTIGLIGQPNVGKSSLLNALFGESKVRASKTPGKTKHFQTLFWTKDVRLVDCPGLVMPNFIPMEMQVLCGILPISRISAIPSCIHYVAELLPLESIYELDHPTLSVPLIEDKRTWRSGTKLNPLREERPSNWTAMDILIAYANIRGWVTAKAGRPDIHRAGNASMTNIFAILTYSTVLRSLAEGKVGWAFWPPHTDTRVITLHGERGAGIWIPHTNSVDEESEGESEDESDSEEDRDSDSKSNETKEWEDDEEGENDSIMQKFGSRFGALLMSDEDDGKGGEHD